MTDPQVIVNLGTGGADLNGQNGSTSSADSNDALFLDWPGDNAGNYVYLPGVSGNYLSVPDEAALDITGDIDIRVQLAMDDWTPSSARSLISKFNTVGNNRSWLIFLTTAGNLSLTFSSDGVSQVAKTSTVATGLSDGSVSWVRVVLDVDNGASGYDVKFYLSDDGSTWSQLGATVTTATATSIYSSTADVMVGSYQNGTLSNVDGKVYRAQVLDGIGGTTVLDVDTSVITSGADTSFTAATGQTVTINRSTSGRKSVALVSPVWLFGTDDYMAVADNALLDADATQDFSVVFIGRIWATQKNFGQYISKRDASSPNLGWDLINNATNDAFYQNYDDGANNIGFTTETYVYGQLSCFGFVVDRTSQTLQNFIDGTFKDTESTTSIGSVANNFPMRIGARASTTTGLADFELLGVAVFRRALTATELAAISTYYTNKAA